jgi:hypothetical protein
MNPREMGLTLNFYEVLLEDNAAYCKCDVYSRTMTTTIRPMADALWVRTSPQRLNMVLKALGA